MPRIELLTPVYYNPNDPIHWEIDNIPLRTIISRQNLINLALDNVISQMRDAIGTQGSVANRLNQSINPDGSLKTAAVDESLHSIEEHVDTDTYVRMTKYQSDKIDSVAEEATDIRLQIIIDEDTVANISDGVVVLAPSETVTFSMDGPNTIKFNLAFPAEAAHLHYYSVEPIHQNIITPDYINYSVSSIASDFIEGSLRIYINGVRIFEDIEVYVPGALVDDAWTLMSYVSDFEAGTFELSNAISEDDVIRIDFDTAFV